jgi:hypothetical protein
MKPVYRNILSVVAGLLGGGILNMALVEVGGMVVPAPAGADVTSMESLKASMHLFTPINFLFPFLAHALGTLVGAILAALIAADHKMLFALSIGVFFLVGGILNILMLPSPLWFTLFDLVVAYIPMGYLGGLICRKSKTGNREP